MAAAHAAASICRPSRAREYFLPPTRGSRPRLFICRASGDSQVHRSRTRDVIPRERSESRDLWGVLYCSRIRVSQIPPLGPCGPSVGMTSGPIQRSENRIGPQQDFFRPWSGRLSQSSSLLASWRRRLFIAYIRSSASARVLEISDAAAQEETPQLIRSGSGYGKSAVAFSKTRMRPVKRLLAASWPAP